MDPPWLDAARNVVDCRPILVIGKGGNQLGKDGVNVWTHTLGQAAVAWQKVCDLCDIVCGGIPLRQDKMGWITGPHLCLEVPPLLHAIRVFMRIEAPCKCGEGMIV